MPGSKKIRLVLCFSEKIDSISQNNYVLAETNKNV